MSLDRLDTPDTLPLAPDATTVLAPFVALPTLPTLPSVPRLSPAVILGVTIEGRAVGPTTSAGVAGRTKVRGRAVGASAVAPATVALWPVTMRLNMASACAVTWSML